MISLVHLLRRPIAPAYRVLSAAHCDFRTILSRRPIAPGNTSTFRVRVARHAMPYTMPCRFPRSHADFTWTQRRLGGKSFPVPPNNVVRGAGQRPDSQIFASVVAKKTPYTSKTSDKQAAVYIRRRVKCAVGLSETSKDVLCNSRFCFRPLLYANVYSVLRSKRIRRRPFQYDAVSISGHTRA